MSVKRDNRLTGTVGKSATTQKRPVLIWRVAESPRITGVPATTSAVWPLSATGWPTGDTSSAIRIAVMREH